MEQGSYYRHSGHFSLGGLFLATAGAGLLVAALSAIYTALILYIPLAGFITFLLAIGFGMGVGLVSGRALLLGKVRNGPLSTAVSATMAFLGVYLSWAAWSWLLLNRMNVEADLMAIVPSPSILWSVMTEVNEAGAWSIGGFTPSGAVLWVLWGLEATLICTPAFFVSLGMTAVPFCERCERWCEAAQDAARISHCEADVLRQGVEASPLDFLKRLGAPSVRDTTWIRADLHACPSCDNLTTLSLREVTVSVNEKGERNEVERELIHQLRVSLGDAEGVRALGASAGESAA
jgi:hypothetical protein